MDPLQEASRKAVVQNLHSSLVGVNRILVLPADFLYTLEFLASQNLFFPSTKIFLVFGDLEIILALLTCRDLSFLQRVQVFFFLDVDQIHDQHLDFDQSQKFFVLSNQVLQKCLPNFCHLQKNKFFDRFSQWFSQCVTQFYFEKLWIKNSIQNLLLKKSFYSLEILRDVHIKQSALVIAPGPSLHREIQRLKTSQNTALLIACDTVLPVLIANQIFPHYVIALDAGYYNSLDFRTIHLQEQISLIAAVQCPPSIVRNFLGKIFFFSCGSELDQVQNYDGIFLLLQQLQISLPCLPTAGSVGHTALAFAHFIGCSHIALVGFDMSYPFFETHVFGGIHFDSYYQKSSRLHPITTGFTQSLFLHLVESSIFVSTNHGTKNFSSSIIQRYCKSLPIFLKKFQLVINTSFYGTNLPFTKYFPLEDFLNSDFFCPVLPSLYESSKIFNPVNVLADNFIESLVSVRKKIEQLCYMLSKGEEFSVELVQNQLQSIFQLAPFLKNTVSQTSFSILRTKDLLQPKQALSLLSLELWKYTTSLCYKLLGGRT